MYNQLITPRESQLETVPTALRDESLVDWKTVVAMLGGGDVAYKRKKFKEHAQELGEKLVRVGPRRELPRLRTVRRVMASMAGVANV
jgi:hypothetical protein